MIIMARSITKDHAFNTLLYIIKEEKEHVYLDSDGADISSASTFLADCSSYSKKNVKKEFISTVISPHVSDNLDLNGMKDLLTEVRNQLKLENRQFFAVIHQNTSTPHIHVISNRIDYDHKTWDDHHVAWKCQEACITLSEKLNLTSAFEKKGTYDKKQIPSNSRFQSETTKNIEFIKNHFLDIKYKATTIDQVLDHLRKKGIEVKVSKFKNGLYGVSMRYNETNVKGSKVDRLLTLLPSGEGFKANSRMEKILDNNKLRKEGRRTQEEISIELKNSHSNSHMKEDLINESMAQMEFELSKYTNYSTPTIDEDDQDYFRKKRKKRDFNI